MRALTILLLVPILSLMAAPGQTHDYCAKARCEETRQRIKKIESKMRQGYSASQGEKLAEALRKQRLLRSKRCG
jgi:hypothetical protein